MKGPRPARLLLLLAATGAVAGGCGQEVAVEEGDPLRRGAVLFAERCSGCHTLDAGAAQGSQAPDKQGGGERTDGPNFNTLRESKEDVLFAIRNGGFSGAIMPANIVVGEDAEQVAAFLAEYAGRNARGGVEDDGP